MEVQPELDEVLAAWSEVELAELTPATVATPIVAATAVAKPKQAGLPGTALAMLAGLVVGRRGRRRDGRDS